MELIKIDIWYQTGATYKKSIIELHSKINREFLRDLRLRIDVELDKIRQHVISLFDNPNNVNLIRPMHIDKEKQIIIDKLVIMRKENLKSKEIIKGILCEEDFIICDWCKSIMYKIPVNVSYSKYGNSYIIHDTSNEIRYIYGCSKDNCVNCIGETEYIVMMKNLELREKLIAKGETFVPNKFGFWHEIK